MNKYSRQLEKAFNLVDASVAAAIAGAAAKGRRLACGSGCDACCRQPIPVTPLECMVLMDHARLAMPEPVRMALLEEYKQHETLAAAARPCPMLLDGGCQAYGVRPLACRRFLSLDRRCLPGEDPVASRPDDMLVPDRSALDSALVGIFPWHKAHANELGLPIPIDKMDPGARLNYMFRITTIIQALDWGAILNRRR